MTRSTSAVAILSSGSSTNWAHRKQYAQYAWQVWPCLGKISTVSGYLCCTPGSGSSPRSGMFSASCPAGCGLSRIRTSCAAALISGSAAPRASRAAIVLYVGRGQHVSLREHQPVDRVVGRRGPVDEFLDDVCVGAERQHGPDRPYRQPLGGTETGPRGQGVEVLRGVRAEPPSRQQVPPALSAGCQSRVSLRSVVSWRPCRDTDRSGRRLRSARRGHPLRRSEAGLTTLR